MPKFGFSLNLPATLSILRSKIVTLAFSNQDSWKLPDNVTVAHMSVTFLRRAQVPLNFLNYLSTILLVSCELLSDQQTDK